MICNVITGPLQLQEKGQKIIVRDDDSDTKKKKRKYYMILDVRFVGCIGRLDEDDESVF